MNGLSNEMKRRFSWFLAAWLVPVLALFALAQPAGAEAQPPQPTPPDDEVNAIASQLYCPVCENIPLDVCPTQACIEWRELIREKLAAGWSGEQIEEYFVEQYGDRVLAEPPRRGLNWLVYVLPPLLILAGAGVLVYVLRSMRLRAAIPSSAAMPPIPKTSNDPFVQRLEEEVRRREME